MALSVFGLDYSSRTKQILKEVSFELEQGRLVALLGPNGAGKTTLLKSVAGLLDDESVSGLVKMREQDIKKLTAVERAQRVAYLGSQVSVDFPMEAYDLVSLGRTCLRGDFLNRFDARDREQIEWAMTQTGCWDLKDRNFQTLSGGEQQRVLIARVLAQGAKILLLDESLSKMDLHHQYEMGKLLRKLASDGFTIVLVAHDVQMALEWADDVMLMKDGMILASGNKSAIATKENFEKIYPNVPLKIN